ncbi:liprin-beta-1-like [Anneissia japonica]|uniref:liprin-beta-1-like n=1 Tax=Anneissia japonica TaxID=1529436 RepID=UPI001425A2A7|nr:liprin-beta-1-like [Anneissia japonica]
MSTSLGADASQMLAAALEQMDDIIAGSSMANMEYNNGVYEVNSTTNSKFSPYRPTTPNKNIIALCEELRIALENKSDGIDDWSMKDEIPEKTRSVILSWIQGHSKQLLTFGFIGHLMCLTLQQSGVEMSNDIGMSPAHI